MTRRRKRLIRIRGCLADHEEMSIQLGLTLELEELDRLRPPDLMFPPRQEPAEAIRQLPFNARLYIRKSAMFIAKWSRTGSWTNPDVTQLNLLKRFIDPTYESLRKDGLTAPYEAVDAYFRKAYRDGEEWYARKRAERGEGGRSTPAHGDRTARKGAGDPRGRTA